MADQKDKVQLNLQEAGISQGERFRHYKGGEYQIIACAVKEDTLEPLIIYQSLLKGSIWARTLKNWNEEVEIDGKLIKRFKKLA